MQETAGQGIYVHVPFCRGKCDYCGFYSVASPAWRGTYLDAIERETRERAGAFPSRRATTLYVGGGTPSALSPGELGRVVDALERELSFDAGAERTIEVNPEDVTRENLSAWRSMGFNRLSIGAQTFSDDNLRLVHRRHSARQAIDATRAAADAGFDNLSVDLITGLPGQDDDTARRDIETLTRLPACHASVYLLSVDPSTRLERLARQGKLALAGDDELAARFAWTSERLAGAGFEHYEISNFARDGRYARHNTAYWQRRHYAGLGPAAHSFDGRARRWNVAHVKRYADAVLSGAPCFEEEILGDADRYNEYVMTSLRVTWGASRRVLREEFPAFYERARPAWERLLDARLLREDNDHFRPTPAFWIISDALLPGLFSA
ncbi:MAG: radical SAM family heme chaperone HemW [Odoribacteraceae bacterium]|jgi:oxygen-independent coproporphyrinogen-3 oxidase|nr:radical SAM family heme chaperone HemW [Odoribacteraceae bacterium]